METMMKTKLGSDVIEQAVRLIKQQEATPESPGALTAEGQVTYCAAGALAAASLQLRGLSNRFNEFSGDIRTSDFSDIIRDVFMEQGWLLDLCHEVMVLNDAFAPHERSQRVIDYFRGIER